METATMNKDDFFADLKAGYHYIGRALYVIGDTTLFNIFMRGVMYIVDFTNNTIYSAENRSIMAELEPKERERLIKEIKKNLREQNKLLKSITK